MIVKRISFDYIKEYWIEVDHFKDPNKKIVEVIKTLGNHVTPFSDPRRISYGLFDNNYMIGATHLVQWTEDLVRYRTLNIRKEYRGNDLGWHLLSEAWTMDWIGYKTLYGYIRDTHVPWATKHGFQYYDDEYVDNHISMIREM